MKGQETHPVPGYWEKWREDVVKSKEMSLAQQVMDVTTDGLIITDMHDRILETNRTMLKLSGYKKEELIGEPVSKLVKIGERFGTLLRLQKIVSGEAVKRTESKIFTKHGREIPITLNARIIGDEKGEPKFTIWALRDITELKEAQEAQRRKLLHTLNLLQKAWSEKRRFKPLPPKVRHAQIFAVEMLKEQLVSGRRPSGIVEAYEELFAPLLKKRGRATKPLRKRMFTAKKCERERKAG